MVRSAQGAEKHEVPQYPILKSLGVGRTHLRPLGIQLQEAHLDFEKDPRSCIYSSLLVRTPEWES